MLPKLAPKRLEIKKEEPEMSSGRITLLPELGVKAMKLFIKALQNQDGRAHVPDSLLCCPRQQCWPWGLGAIRAGVQGREGSWGCEGIRVFI